MAKFKYNHESFVNCVDSKILDGFEFITKFNGVLNHLILRHIDSDCLFKITPSKLLSGNNLCLHNCIDKDKYFKYLVHKNNPTITIIGEYIHSHKKILVEDELGIKYNVFPTAILNYKTQSSLSAIDKTTWFITKSNLIHNFKYDYSISKYKNKRSSINITCPYHGIFTQNAGDHLRGSGCIKCGYESNSTGFTKKKWIDSAMSSKNMESFKVYILELWNDSERFVKVGRTFVSIDKRFGVNVGSRTPYKYNVIHVINGDGSYIYDLENIIHRSLVDFKYIPSIHFQGDTECFKIDVLENNILNEFIKL